MATNRIDILDACSKEVPRAGVATSAVRTTSSSSSSSSSSTTNLQKVYYTVKSGDVLGTIASKNQVYLADIKRWNKLSSNTIHVGQRLVIYKKGSGHTTTNSSVSTAKTSSSTTKSTSSTTNSTPSVYYVRSGDSLWTISQKFPGVTVDKIKKLNGLTSNSIKVGQKLILN